MVLIEMGFIKKLILVQEVPSGCHEIITPQFDIGHLSDADLFKLMSTFELIINDGIRKELGVEPK